MAIETIKIRDDGFRSGYRIINKSDFDPDKHTPVGDANAPSAGDLEVDDDGDGANAGGDPSDELVEAVGTRYANRLADAGITSLGDALALSEDDIDEIPGVGQATYDALHDDE